VELDADIEMQAIPGTSHLIRPHKSAHSPRRATRRA
jgi:hypothetical protein